MRGTQQGAERVRPLLAGHPVGVVSEADLLRRRVVDVDNRLACAEAERS
ncbi:hypothetical protein [Streptomyces sp. NPDC002054]